MALTDGRDTAPSPFGIAVCIVLGGVIWLVEKAWDLVVSIVEFIF